MPVSFFTNQINYSFTVPDPPVTSFVLNSSTNGSVVPLTSGVPLTFEDSGQSSNYSNSESFSVIFDAGANGSASILFNDFSFEHTTYTMYDWLGIDVSSSVNTGYSNINIPWMQTSSTSSNPWSSSYGGSAWNSTSSKNGWIVPQDTVRAILLGWDEGAFTINAQYIRFTFRSDGSVTKPGWNVSITKN